MKNLYEEFEDIDAVVRYLETCVEENFQINGDSTLQFPNIGELVETYLNDTRCTVDEINQVIEACSDNKTINSLVANYFLAY